MSGSHPADEVDAEDAIRRMTAAYVTGRYWDERAIRVNPALVHASAEDCWRVLEHIAEGDPSLGEPGDFDSLPDPLPTRYADAIADWMPLRAEHGLASLREIPIVDGHVQAWRAVQCHPADLRSALGVHWTWDLQWNDGATVKWPPKETEGVPELLLHAIVPVSSIDWQTTLLCAMDYVCGDDEREIRLHDGAALRLLSVETLIGGKAISIPACGPFTA